MLRIENHQIQYSGQNLFLIHTIENALEFEDGILVLLNIFNDKIPTRKLYDNVLFLNKDMSIRWQIEGRKPRFYTAIFKFGSQAKALDWEGFSNSIDLDTGKVIKEEFPN
ncbi:hypothetical protein [Bdellovibrio sp. KM01]|uniref:hypothetical protein n=1 Tax=Bdellovibrio sp. KM01 TaxID=2748865 RepID=UPI0015E91710|nr:hypothetical protein [Bdellovibrio sp. KM01]QLY25941.1 hypothetical protein HW988_02575 [Bdellovibrio sp. KM01]